jgi:hypothetical protein
MPYNQGRNPISRKNSPLNARNPFSRVSPLSMKAEDGTPHRKMDDETKAKHKAEMHSKGRDPEQDEVMREEDMGQEANQPMGPERRSAKSPLNVHEPGHEEPAPKPKGGIGSSPRLDPCSYEFDYDAASDAGITADQIKKYREANCPKGGEEAPAEEVPAEGAPMRKSSSPLNETGKEDTSEGDKRNRAYKQGQDKEVSDAKKVEPEKEAPKPKSRREKKIDKAEKSGKTRKAKRLKGREERKKVRKQRKEGKISRSQKTHAIKESRKNQQIKK